MDMLVRQTYGVDTGEMGWRRGTGTALQTERCTSSVRLCGVDCP